MAAALNRFFRNFNFSCYVDNTLIRDTSHVLDHFLWHIVTLEGNGLNSSKSFSKNNETIVSFGSNVMDSSSDKNLLFFESVVELCNSSPCSSGLEDGFEERIISILIDFIVDYFGSLILFHATKICCWFYY